MTIEGVLSGSARWTVVQGDCLAVLSSIPIEHRAIVAGDPPYGYGSYKHDRDIAIDFLLAAHGWRTLALKGYAQDLYRWLHAAGIEEVKEWVTWFPSNYSNKANGNRKGLPRWHEDWAVCGEVPGSGRLTRARADHKISARINELHRGHHKDHSSTYDPQSPARMGDVWTDASPGIAFQAHLRLHPNETPVGVQLKLVELISNPGGLIVDAFAGSASLGVACLRLGRRYIGIEIAEEWASLARERLIAEEDGSTFLARKAGQLPLLGGAR